MCEIAKCDVWAHGRIRPLREKSYHTMSNILSMYMLSQPIKCIHIGIEMYGNFYKAVIDLQIDLLCVRHSAIMLQVLHFQGVATIC